MRLESLLCPSKTVGALDTAGSDTDKKPTPIMFVFYRLLAAIKNKEIKLKIRIKATLGKELEVLMRRSGKI